MRRALILAALVSAAATAPAGADTAKTCPSQDLRYPFQKGGPKTFGVFKLKIAAGSCAAAHSGAKAFKQKFTKAYNLPKHAGGWKFQKLPATAAQTYNMVGAKGSATMTFQFVVPNG